MRRVLSAVACCAAAAILVAASGTSSTPDDRAVIAKTRSRQNEAIARRDFQTATTFWTQDVSARAGLGRSLQGHQEYLAAFIADSAMTYVREPIEIVVSPKWPLAYERGRWTGRLRTSDANPLLSGQYSAQWVKVGTAWLIRSEVFVAIDCAAEACAWPAAVP